MTRVLVGAPEWVGQSGYISIIGSNTRRLESLEANRRVDANEPPRTIALLLTDIVMPEMSECEIATAVSAFSATLPCSIYMMSDYPNDDVFERGPLAPIASTPDGPKWRPENVAKNHDRMDGSVVIQRMPRGRRSAQLGDRRPWRRELVVYPLTYQ